MRLFTTQIESGMRYLDSVDPGWERKVDVDKLHMWSSHLCVLGQTQGSYDLHMIENGFDMFWAVEHGFLMGPVPHGADWTLATIQWNEEWKSAIRARQQQQKPVEAASQVQERELVLV